MENVFLESIKELHLDLADQRSLISLVRSRLEEIRSGLSTSSLKSTLAQFCQQLGVATDNGNEPPALEAESRNPTKDTFNKLLSEKHLGIDSLRFASRMISTLWNAYEWQSPVLTDTGELIKGRNLGPIGDNYFFYKRERHHLCKQSEENLLHLLGIPASTEQVKGWLFSSGMSAFNTALQYIINAGPPKLLVGTSAYCENRELLYTVLPSGSVTEFNDQNLEDLSSLLVQHQPTSMLIDTLANCHSQSEPEITQLLEILSNKVDDSFTLIIDDTCGLKSSSIIEWLNTFQPSFTVLIIHSLAKYLQFGLDVVSGGLIISWSTKEFIPKFDRLRQLCGTILNDQSVMSLPSSWASNEAHRDALKNIFRRRMERIHRNNSLLHRLLNENPSVFSSILAPPSNTGSLLFLTPALQLKSISEGATLCEKLVTLARQLGVSLTHGSSFGFDISRLAMSRVTEHGASPGIRFSVGTESTHEIYKLAYLIQHPELTSAIATNAEKL